MASQTSILKNILNLNRVHVESQDLVNVPVSHYGEAFEENSYMFICGLSEDISDAAPSAGM
ncbi:MAG: hypothetical protein IJV40_06675 [Oscillospiraceae bacterium]|nr:hypothetical protein [Oscillospiraceae bacterium]